MKRTTAVNKAIMIDFQDFIDEKDLGITLEGTDDFTVKEVSRLRSRIETILSYVLKFTDKGLERHPEAIKNQEERLGMLSLLIESFEETLHALGIKDIENDEKEGDDGASMIYGTDYGNLEQTLSNTLIKHGCLFDEQYYLDQSQPIAASAPSKEYVPENQTLVITIGFSDMSRENILIRTSGKDAEKAKELILKAYEDWQADADSATPSTLTLEEIFENTLKKHHIPFTTEDFDVLAFDLE